MQDINPGDVVRLKSGGPNMTASSRPTDHIIRCIWFVHEEKREEAFAPEALELVEKS